MAQQLGLFDPEWYSPKMLCEALRISRATLSRLQREGRIPQPQRWGYKTLRWQKATVQAIIMTGPTVPGTYPPDPTSRRRPRLETAAADQVQDLEPAAAPETQRAAAGDGSLAAAPGKQKKGKKTRGEATPAKKARAR